jgi:phosphate acetyltransferase
MREILESIRTKSKANPKRIVLPETDDSRTIEAINYLLDNRIAKVIAIGRDEVRRKIRSKNTGELELLDPEKYEKIEELAAAYYELRKHKGMTPEEANRLVREERLIFGALFVRKGLADGFVAGASHTTPDVVRTTIHCLEIDKEIGTISSSFLMVVPECRYGESGAFLFADCGVNPDPNPNQLAGTAIASARLFKMLVGATPRIAFLSYSSKGSAKGPLVDKVVEAVRRTKERAPGLVVDGELQVDSAIVPEVAKRKCPESDVAGKANVLIFPSLDAGNISYKLVQRLARARAVGPLLMGALQPCSDLSRGCDANDIIDAVAVTSVRAG